MEETTFSVILIIATFVFGYATGYLAMKKIRTKNAKRADLDIKAR